MRKETGALTQGIEQIVAALLTSRSGKASKPSMRGGGLIVAYTLDA